MVAYNIQTGVAHHAWIIMSRGFSWEDSAVDIWTAGHDWKTFSGHEFGHLAGIGHGSSASVMKAAIAKDWVQRDPTSHDGWHMGNLY